MLSKPKVAEILTVIVVEGKVDDCNAWMQRLWGCI